MLSIVDRTERALRDMIEAAAAAATAAGELPEGTLPAYTVEVPGDRKNGDLAANVAMVSARAFHAAPPESER